ncbi:MAG: PhoH family protein, partial [Microbacterium sp.]|nr:PhoH family protein [Microbacterium sp.]
MTTRTAQQATSTAQQATRKTSSRASSADPDQDLRTYVLDTSVLLSDPQAFFRFAEHSVVVPVVVITELEGKRHDPEIGYFARQALRHLDDLRIEHGRLD